MKMLKRNEDAFTGLEAAIVLIAFVVVAAVFSYVVLGAGFFTTQKSQQVVHAGVTQAASNIVVKGNVYGIGSDSNTTIGKLQFDIGLAAGGLPVDITKITMTWSTQNATPYNLNYTKTNKNQAGYWWVESTNSPNDLLQEGQFFTVQVQPKANLTAREQFDLELKPENGAALGIQRTVPAGITQTTLLY
jgi:flagellin FlaB